MKSFHIVSALLALVGAPAAAAAGPLSAIFDLKVDLFRPTQTPDSAAKCQLHTLGNGICDADNNNEECEWDMGDCCQDSGKKFQYAACGGKKQSCCRDPHLTQEPSLPGSPTTTSSLRGARFDAATTKTAERAASRAATTTSPVTTGRDEDRIRAATSATTTTTTTTTTASRQRPRVSTTDHNGPRPDATRGSQPSDGSVDWSDRTTTDRWIDLRGRTTTDPSLDLRTTSSDPRLRL